MTRYGAMVCAALAALAATAADWPSYLGPRGNNGTACTAPLVERLGQARLLWQSDVELPNGMAGDGRNPTRDGTHFVSGGYASPVLADGKVYVQYYVPSGEVSQTMLKLRGEAFADKFRIEADDVIHCFDAATGMTLWKTVLPKTSMNMQVFTKGGPSLTCCVADGKVFAHLNGGLVVALDAKSGEKLWEFRTARFPYQEKLRAEARARKEMALYNRDFKTSPAVIDGVLLFSDHLYHKTAAPGTGDNWVAYYEAPSNLVALDAATGKELWRLANGLSSGAQPVPWTCDGRAYVLANGGDRVVRCIEPKTGTVLWKVQTGDGLTPAVDGAYMVCGDPDAAANGKKEARHAGYRISATAAEKVWTLQEYGRPGLTWPACAGGFAYIESSPRGKLLCIEMATGKVAATAPAAKEMHFGYWPQVMGSRILCGGADSDQLHWYTSDPKDFRLLDDAPIPNAWGYEMAMQSAMADGRMYLRTHSRLVCIDLRAEATEGEPLAKRDYLREKPVLVAPATPPTTAPKVPDAPRPAPGPPDAY